MLWLIPDRKLQSHSFYRERDGMSPTLDNESSKSHRDSFEIDLDSCAEGNKVDHYSEEGKIFMTDEKLCKFRHDF